MKKRKKWKFHFNNTFHLIQYVWDIISAYIKYKKLLYHILFFEPFAYVTSQFKQTTFQVFSRQIWLVATILDSVTPDAYVQLSINTSLTTWMLMQLQDKLSIRLCFVVFGSRLDITFNIALPGPRQITLICDCLPASPNELLSLLLYVRWKATRKKQKQKLDLRLRHSLSSQ